MEQEKLVKKRGSVKAKLTIFEKYVNNLEISYPNYMIDDQNLYLELEQRLERFQTVLDEYEDLQGQIEVNSDTPETHYIDREAFETAFYGVVARSKRFLMANSLSGRSSGVGSHVSAPQGSHSGFLSSDNRVLDNNNAGGVKLPVIEIMSYDGEYNKWLEFRDTYESLIHKNTSLSDIQKYHYLRSYLGPSVLEIIASLGISGANYENAWKLICDRFNNSRILIQNHVKALFNINKIPSESSCALRKLIDNVAKHLRALKTLEEPTDTWDTLIIYLITTKLDDATLRKWEQVKASYKTPSLENLTMCLKERADLLESLEQSKQTNLNNNFKRDKKVKSFYSGNATGTLGKPRCSFCKKEHYIQDCEDFLKFSVNDRIEQAKRKRLCLNCLKSGHLYRQCFSGPCKTCNAKHHTLLHIVSGNKSKDKATDNNNRELQQESVNLSSSQETASNQVLLSTVLVNIFDKNNKPHVARALLDVGSQSSFLTEKYCTQLKISRSFADIKVSGLNETQSECKSKCTVRVKSKINEFSTQISCLVVPQITGNLPNFKVDKRSLKLPSNLPLADPYFEIPGEIDMLIGADCFWDVICVGQVKLGDYGPYLQKTKFGWVVSGRVEGTSSHVTQCNLVRNADIDRQLLSRFWEIEEFPCVKPMSLEKKACEKHFLDTFTRDEDERFEVTIPLLMGLENLGESYDTAEKRFLALERKFERKEDFKKQYFKFIEEYKSLGHMSQVKGTRESTQAYYMPHHGVLKESSLTTKLRVVFDASCPTTSDYSFNDLQMTGPSIQSDIFSILIRFRQHNYVIAADVEKMYRMCKVQPEQRCLQRILWRDDPNKPIDTYELQTVTYGTKSASYLAIRCLYQLGIECEDEYSVASEVIKHDFYVDDLLTGATSINKAISLANEVLTILGRSGFHLRKWMSNSVEVLEGINTSDKTDIIDLGANENTKTLGLLWNGKNDFLSYKIGIHFSARITKRTVLSEISQVFDPLGLLSACIILAKIILRDIWLERIGWDSSLPQALHTRWLQFRDELSSINDLNTDRQVTCKNAVRTELHGLTRLFMLTVHVFT